jgi:hypothetical protein
MVAPAALIGMQALEIPPVAGLLPPGICAGMLAQPASGGSLGWALLTSHRHERRGS